MHMLYCHDGDTTRFRVLHIDRGSIYRGDGIVGQPARWIGGPPQEGADPEVVLQALLQRAAEEGYAAQPQHTLMVQYAIDGWGNDADLSRRHTVESLLTNALVGFGYGTVDGGDIGSGKMTVYASVLQPAAAAAHCVAALQETPFLDGAVIVSAPPDDSGAHVAHWPEGYRADQFSIL